jgi:hypothetical protein
VFTPNQPFQAALGVLKPDTAIRSAGPLARIRSPRPERQTEYTVRSASGRARPAAQRRSVSWARES